MKRSQFTLSRAAIIAISICGLAVALMIVSSSNQQSSQIKPQFLRFSFEPNIGQAEGQARFVGRSAAYDVLLLSDRIRLLPSEQPRGEGMDIVLRSSWPLLKSESNGTNSKIVPLDELPGKVNFLMGADPRAWKTNIPTYGEVSYVEIQPGVTVSCHSSGAFLEIDWHLAAGADPDGITFELPSVDNARTNNKGDIIATVGQREFELSAPKVYQLSGNGRQYVTGRIIARGRHLYGFSIGSYDRSRELVIDPELAYSTVLGATSTDFGSGIAVDSSGNFYLTGSVSSADDGANGQPTFPLVNALQGWDGPTTKKPPAKLYEFLTKFAAGGASLVYSTYLGGTTQGYPQGVAVDSGGNAYVVGNTTTSGGSVFVQKINSSGSALVYSTYIGGNGTNLSRGIALDSSGDAYITGSTSATNFPLVNAYQSTCSGCGGSILRAFVSKLNASGSGFVFSTYLGGTGTASPPIPDQANAIAVDASGNAYVTGWTSDKDFPTHNAFQPHCGGTCSLNVFLTKFSPTGSLSYSTYLGGSSSDIGYGVAVDLAGDMYVTGAALSSDFPLSHSLYTPQGGGDAFITKFNSTGSSLVYSTLVGGGLPDQGNGIAADSSGDAFVVGTTESTNFPMIDPIQSTLNGRTSNPFVCEINSGGTAFKFCTYFGGSTNGSGLGDTGTYIVLDSVGNPYFTGKTTSTDFPITPGAYQSGLGNAFAVKFALP